MPVFIIMLLNLFENVRGDNEIKQIQLFFYGNEIYQ